MIDVSEKPISHREAEASGEIILKRDTIERIKRGEIEKGDALAIAEIAAIQSVKKTHELIPLCHPLRITHVDVKTRIKESSIELSVSVKADEKTGVEMEALTGVLIGLLTIWDVVKKYEKSEEGEYPTTRITDVRVIKKVKRSV